jgi:hypothetical protein
MVLVCLVLSLALAFGAPTVAAASSNACSRDMTLLLRNIKRPAAATRGLTRATVRRSLGACSGPAQWRTQADRVGIAAALGPLLDDKALETDRALDRLCTVFDAYQGTTVCKHHLDQ